MNINLNLLADVDTHFQIAECSWDEGNLECALHASCVQRFPEICQSRYGSLSVQVDLWTGRQREIL